MKRVLILLAFAFCFLCADAQIDKKKAFFLLNQSSGQSVDSDYQAVLDRATTLGYTLPSAGQQVKQNQLVVDLKAAGVWSLLDVFYVFATDGNNNFATLNWKAPSSFKLTITGGVTFTADQGFNSNGTTGYLATGWNPSTNGVNLTLNSASIATYIYNHVTENKYDLGTAPNFTGSGPWLYFRADDGFGSTIASVNAGSTSVTANGGNSVGFWMSQRKDATNNYIFKNGAQVDVEADASTSVANAELFLLCVRNGTAPSFFSTKKLSMFSAGASLNGLESAFYTAWNTYRTSL